MVKKFVFVKGIVIGVVVIVVIFVGVVFVIKKIIIEFEEEKIVFIEENCKKVVCKCVFY